MRRREFISLLGGAAVAWPLAARAQEPGRIYRLGILFLGPRRLATNDAFFEGMRRYGFVEGQNLLDDPNGYELRTEQFAGHASEIVKQGVDLIGVHRRIIRERVALLSLPAMYQFPEMAEEGGLIAYGTNIVQVWREIVPRQAAALLRGAKVADVPVEQPSKFDLVINLKTAKALGLSIPESFLLRADTVIE